jgi:outer membrane protein assembly factor BamA
MAWVNGCLISHFFNISPCFPLSLSLFRICGCLCLLAFPSPLAAQWRLEMRDSTYKKGAFIRQFDTREMADQFLHGHYSKTVADGYLDATMDTTIEGQTISCDVRKGKRYMSGAFRWTADSIRQDFLRALLPRARLQPFDPAGLETKAETIIQYLEDRGYPFGSVSLNALTLRDSIVEGDLVIRPGPYITLDSLVIRSEERMPAAFIRNYLHFQKGAPYNESQMASVAMKLKEISFLESIQVPEVLFKGNKATLYVFVKRKKANLFNGVIGIRPDEANERTIITGDVDIRLVNAVNGGDDLQLTWRRLQPQTQELFLRSAFPFVLKLPIGLDGSLRIYRRDSTFSTARFNAGILFQLGGGNFTKVFVETNRMNRISSGLVAVNNDGLAQVNTTLFGAALQWSRLDYRFNPRTGWNVQMEAAVGRRDLSNTGSEIPLSAGDAGRRLFKPEGRVEGYVPVFQRQTIRIAATGAGYFTEAIALNEMYRIGGLRTIRGVNEESIFATTWAMATLEYRFLFEANSAVYAFVDQAWYEQRAQNNYLRDTPVGAGVGVNFAVKSGIFTFNYALGQQFDNPVLVRNAKISFGFVSIF